ncbi:FlgD immunoglobulin-like domain containing protein [Candidatus Cloacimonadota bacterium]
MKSKLFLLLAFACLGIILTTPGSLLNSTNIYFGPRQDILTFEEAFDFSQSGDHLIKSRIDTIRFKRGIKWLSFPALDVVLDDANLASYVLYDILDPNILEEVDAKTYIIDYNSLNQTWNNITNQFLRTQGFIFEMNDDFDLDVPGFKVSDETSIAVYGSSVENWVGYWIDETQHVSDAFEDYWEDENITLIQHQFWSAIYRDEEWGYKMTNEQEPTLSYGDMVIVKCGTTISNFQWSTGTPEEQRTVFPDTEYYSFTEQTSYTPIFIELEENDQPQEIGAFVNGTCIGATVVDGSLAQINAYTSSAPSGNVELEFYYNSRSANKIFSNYNCGNLEDPDYVSQQINTSENADAWFVSFRDDSSMVPTQASITLNNYPNPFNPSTTISYNLPHEDQVTLSIYNIKGQLVKILVQGSQPEGYYEVVWNGNDEAGKHVSSGIYYYRINACGKTLNKKMIILK